MTQKLEYSRINSIRLDPDTDDELVDIALFERKKKAVLLRDIIVEKVRVYQRNPQYLRFKKQLEARKNAFKP